MERLSYGSHRAGTAERSQLDPDGRLWLAVRCTANAGRMAPTACSRQVLLFKQFNDVSKHFKDMLDKDRVTYLMSVNGENIVEVAKYCFEGFEKKTKC